MDLYFREQADVHAAMAQSMGNVTDELYEPDVSDESDVPQDQLKCGVKGCPKENTIWKSKDSLSSHR